MDQPVVTFDRRSAVGIVRLSCGELVHPGDLASVSHQFRQYVAEHADLPGFVLDLAALDYMTSAAIGMVVNMHAHLQAEGKQFAVVVSGGVVGELFQHTHLAEIFPVCRSIDEAIAAVS